jgi:L-lysine exporter family protein LysE/ArgO
MIDLANSSLTVGGTFGLGFVLAGSLILAIGAQNAFVLRQGLRKEYVLPIVLFCSIADLLLITAGVLGLGAVIKGSQTLITLMTVGGAIFIAWYGVQSLRKAFDRESLDSNANGHSISLKAAMLQVAGFTFLNPHVYLDTVLLVGSVGAQQPADLRPWFIAGCATASAAWFFSLGFGAALLSPWFAKPRTWQALHFVIGILMLVMAALLLRGLAIFV